jgi:hypothetical protein
MITRFRMVLTLALLVVTPLGFAAKFWYCGSFDAVVADYGAGSLYEVFWILVVLWICPRVSMAKAALGVFFVTCVLECMQLWHPPFLEAIRAHALGRILIGTTFSWSDFPFYVAGSGAGYALGHWLARISAARVEGY